MRFCQFVGFCPFVFRTPLLVFRKIFLLSSELRASVKQVPAALGPYFLSHFYHKFPSSSGEVRLFVSRLSMKILLRFHEFLRNFPFRFFYSHS